MNGTDVDGTRADGRVTDVETLAQAGQRLDKADEGRLAGKVQRRLQRVDVAAQTGNPQQVAVDVAVLEPVVDGNLGQADGAHGVDGKRLVHARAAVLLVLGDGRDARGVPEGAGGRLVDARAVAEDVDAAELGDGGLPQRRDLGPVADVGLLERGCRLALGGGSGPRVEERLGFGAELDVGHHDGAAGLEELLGEGQVDAGAGSGDDGILALDVVGRHDDRWYRVFTVRVHRGKLGKARQVT